MKDFEKRLDELREEARTKGVVDGAGVHAAGGPVPAYRRTANPESERGAGYYDVAMLKPPVWIWMISVYFFVGGLGGMAALLAAVGWWHVDLALVRVSVWSAGASAVLSPLLLVFDLGRPKKFINMLRVLKPQSPMSLGTWIVSGFGACAIPAVLLMEWHWRSGGAGDPGTAVGVATLIAVHAAALFGIFLSTYTGALLAVTVIPAWNRHRLLLPFHFGLAGLGSAAAVPELIGFREPALQALGWFAAGAQTLVMIWLEVRKHGAADAALHHGKSGWLLRVGEVLEGPLALGLRAFGLHPLAAASYLLGSLVARFGWVEAGQVSACDPAAALAAYGPDSDEDSAGGGSAGSSKRDSAVSR